MSRKFTSFLRLLFVSFLYFSHQFFLQVPAEATSIEGVAESSRHLLSSKSTLTLQLLIHGLEQSPLDDKAQQALLRFISDSADVDIDSVIIESVEYPPPVLVECKTNRYVCEGTHFVDHTTYIAALNGTCTSYEKMGVVSCLREILTSSLYETIRGGSCICDTMAPVVSAAAPKQLHPQDSTDTTIVLANINLDTSTEARAARNQIISAFDASKLQARTEALLASNFGNISVELGEKLELEPARVVYFWTVGPWQKCSVECGGGVQSRIVLCKSTHHQEQVGNWLCEKQKKPIQWQPCNPQTCDLQLFNFSEKQIRSRMCDHVCHGIQYGSVHCVGENGYIGDTSYCPDWKGIPPISACGKPDCKEKDPWILESWGKCDRKCGTGKMLLERDCSWGTKSDQMIGACNNTNSKWIPCNTISCDQHTWDISSWGDCDAPCGGGKMYRLATCKNKNGIKINGRLCGPKPKLQAWCNLSRCNFCKDNNCSNHGICTNGRCICYQGYKGDLCELMETCNGVLDSSKSCCESGIIDHRGVCCENNSLVSRSGECCKTIDVEGNCSGNSSYISHDNRGCKTILDAGGACCISGHLDDCGVCDGDSSSCGFSVEIVVQVNDATLLQNTQESFLVVREFLAKLLTIPINETKDFHANVVDEDTVRTLIQITINIRPNVFGKNTSTLSTHYIWLTFRKFIGEEIPNFGIFYQTKMVKRIPMCGNNICEMGERAVFTQEINGSYTLVGGCLKDCNIPFKECKVGTTTTSKRPKFCSGHGTCFTSSGKCDCWVGYTGDDCSICSQGYFKSKSICIPLFTVEGLRFESAYEASTISQPLMIIIAFISLLAFVSLVVGIFALRSRNPKPKSSYFSKIKSSSELVDENNEKQNSCLDVARALSYHAPRALSSPMINEMKYATTRTDSPSYEHSKNAF